MQDINPLISVLILNYNSSDFIKLSLYSLTKLTKNSYKVYILDNGSNISDYRKISILCKKYKNVFLHRNETDLRGSYAHGDGLNKLVKYVDTPYFSILDADAIWLRKNWDEILLKQLNDKIKVIGTQAPVGTKKYQNFPLVFAILFETETFNNLNIDFTPPDLDSFKDVGYVLKEKYLSAGFKGKNIEMKNTRTYKDGFFKNRICAEFYLDNDYKNIFANHFGRGSQEINDRFNVNLWYYRFPILSYFTKMYNRQIEKYLWLKTCKQIIDKQI